PPPYTLSLHDALPIYRHHHHSHRHHHYSHRHHHRHGGYGSSRHQPRFHDNGHHGALPQRYRWYGWGRGQGYSQFNRGWPGSWGLDRKSTRLNSSHLVI